MRVAEEAYPGYPDTVPELMERAGSGVAYEAMRVFPYARRFAVVCGGGSNGGDGRVAARVLRDAGREAVETDAVEGADVVVDALFGTGFHGTPRAEAAALIDRINDSGAPVVSVDVPSGVDASTGEVAGVAIEAVATATFHRSKPGLWIRPGKAHTGRVHVIDIGIPRRAPAKPDMGLIGDPVIADIPRRGADSTKFTSGNVFVIGGSSGLSGAPTMAALAAMRAGAGYVTVGAPAHLESTFSVRLLEAMMVGLPSDEGSLAPEAVEPALRAIRRADAVVLGPGLGSTPAARAFAREMFERIDVPLVIDADGLNALAGVFPEDLPQRRWPTVLTPHAGELGRLLEVDSSDVEAHRLRHAREAAQRSRAFVVLKGDDTIVSSPNGRVAISRGGAPGLATAGTGDVLSGITGAMLAKRLPPAHAACAAVFAHVRAGRLAAAPHGPDGVIASDVIQQLPAAFAV